MTDLAQWLMMAILIAPLLGAVCGLLVSPLQSSMRASRCTTVGVFGSCVAAISLAVIMPLQRRVEVSADLGLWLRTVGPRVQQIDCALHLDPWTAIALAGLAVLTWLTMQLPSSGSGDGTAKIAMAVILFGITGLVMSSSLVILFVFWLVISAATLMMSAWSSTPASVESMRRMLFVGLIGDLLLLWVIMLIGLAGGSNSFVDIRSMSLSRLATGNPALPELVCSLIVLSSFSRCGVFPLLGWNSQAANWDTKSCIAVYSLGYVPAGIWMLLKCQPLLATSQTALSMLNGFGLLAAVLGAFVACAQPNMHQRIGFLVGSQIGLLLAALSSGSPEAVSLSLWHQMVISIATFLLFLAVGKSVGPRIASIAALAGAMATAGLFPFGGWTQRELVEVANQPRVVSPIQLDRPDEAADATEPANVPWHVDEDFSQNRQLRMWGLIAAQAMSAFAISRGFAELVRQRSVVISNVGASIPLAAENVAFAYTTPAIKGTTFDRARNNSAGADWIVGIGVIWLVIVGPLGWWLQVIAIPDGSEEWTRWGITQVVIASGLLVGWQSARSAKPATGRWESLARLSREQLFLEQSIQQVVGKPAQILGLLSLGVLNAAANGQAWRTLTVQLIGRLGSGIEGLQTSRTDFYIATILLGTATVLLTLFLVV